MTIVISKTKGNNMTVKELKNNIADLEAKGLIDDSSQVIGDDNGDGLTLPAVNVYEIGEVGAETFLCISFDDIMEPTEAQLVEAASQL